MINPKELIKFWSLPLPGSLWLLGAFYALVYDFVYREFVDSFYSMELKSEYISLDGWYLLIYVFLASFPFIFYKGLQTVAASFSLFTYIIVYIPVLNALFAYSFSEVIVIEYSITFFICMCFFFRTDSFYLLKYLFDRDNKLIPFRILEIFVFLCMVMIVLMNLSQLTFVNFLESQVELYEARADNDLKGVYFICWMRSCFLPLIMVVSLREKNYRKYLLVFLAFILIFMLDKQKLTAVFPIVLTVLFFVTKKGIDVFSTYFHAILIFFVAIVSLSIVAYILFTETTFTSNPILFSLAALFVMRTQCIEGMETERYISFFVEQNNPPTYYSHVNIINAFTNAYPYEESIGATVAGDGGNSNATFWLMDGVAAMGVPGVIIISFLFIVFKSLMNSADLRCSVPIYVCISLQGIMSMLNVSLFTAINTSGMLMLYFVLLFVKTNLSSDSKLGKLG